METDTFFHFAVEWKHVIHILQQQDFSDVTLGLGRKTKFAKIHNYQKLTLFNGPCFVMDKKKKKKRVYLMFLFTDLSSDYTLNTGE